jgi:hypothetical protein
MFDTEGQDFAASLQVVGSSHTMALRFTHPLTEMSDGNLRWGGDKGPLFGD